MADIAALGPRPECRPILMRDQTDKERLAREVMDLARNQTGNEARA